MDLLGRNSHAHLWRGSFLPNILARYAEPSLERQREAARTGPKRLHQELAFPARHDVAPTRAKHLAAVILQPLGPRVGNRKRVALPAEQVQPAEVTHLFGMIGSA